MPNALSVAVFASSDCISRYPRHRDGCSNDEHDFVVGARCISVKAEGMSVDLKRYMRCSSQNVLAVCALCLSVRRLQCKVR